MPLVGSSPTASAWGHSPTGRRWFRIPAIRVRLPVTPLRKRGPVVQRPRRLVHTQETMVQLHPGPLRLGRQPADHLGLEPGMLWVRLPPEPLEREHALVEQPGVLACLSRRRSRVQIPSRALATNTARYANRQSGQAQTLVNCGFDSRLRHLKSCVGWASASPTACKAAAFGMCRFNSCSSH